jgi:F-type H+-transporting ATPase subunit delta
MTRRSAAIRYAKALLDVAVREGDPRRAERELAIFAGLVDSHADLAKALGNPAVPGPTKRGIVQAILERTGPWLPSVSRLLLLLADRGRLTLLPLVVEAYGDRLLDHLRVVRARVTTAVGLEPGQKETIERGLAAVTGRQIVMDVDVDAAILGGVVTRIGSLVYDGSVVRQLARMRGTLAESA